MGIAFPEAKTGLDRIRSVTERPRHKRDLPDAAKSVFALGGWEALNTYASNISAGVYRCPDRSSSLDEIHHHGACVCCGLGAVRINQGSGL